MKQIKLMVLALFLVALVAPAFAGQVVTGTPPTVAYEILGTARNASILPPVLTLGNTLQNGSIVTMNMSGGAVFTPGATYYICANNTDTAPNVVRVGYGAAAAANTQLPISISGLAVPGANVILGQPLWLTNNVACNVPTVGSFNFMVGPGASAGSPARLSGNVVLTGTSSLMDTFAANTIAAVNMQYTTTLNTGVLVAIDYITGPANGTTFVDDNLPGTNLIAGSNTLTVVNTTLSYNVQNVGGAFNQVVTITDSRGDWAGVSRAFIVGSTDCTSPALVAANVPASGNIVLHYPNAANAASNTTLCINVAGNVAINSRTISGSYAYEVAAGTGLNLPASGVTSSVWQTWTPNGYQAFNPYMYVGTSQDTLDVFCRFYNTSGRTAQVFVDVYPADGSDVSRFTLDSIPSNTAGTYWGSTIGALASLDVGTSYAALFTITATPAQINGVSFFKRSTGERQLPLFKQVYTGGVGDPGDTYLSQ